MISAFMTHDKYSGVRGGAWKQFRMEVASTVHIIAPCTASVVRSLATEPALLQ